MPGGSISAERPRIAIPGRNCWRAPAARRAAVLVDAAAYFASLEETLRLARRSILIVGWDFDGAVRLKDSRSPALGELLRSLVEAHPALEVRILVWNLSTVHGPGASAPLLLGAAWQEHARITLRLDGHHPLLAAHHQKIVCIDDAVAFAGGIDLTLNRWDTTRHAAADEARTNADGTGYGPVHDLQMAVDGEAARDLAELARDRWAAATGEQVPPGTASGDIWPPGLSPDFRDVAVLIARTVPRWRGLPGIHEAITLTMDALSAARDAVYLEAQYLTSVRIRNLLGDILTRPRGPEVVIVASCSSEGPVERFVMGANRDRFIRRLKRLDRFDRFRVLYPVVPSADGEQPVLVHSKLVIVDEHFLRVGSSNLNNRSVGLDTECDLAIEAENAATAAAIGRLRNGLLAEHLGVEGAAVTAAFETGPSLIRVLERLGGGPRSLRPFAAMSGSGPASPIPGTGLLDPEAPMRLLEFLPRRVLPRPSRAGVRARVARWRRD